MYIVKLDVLFYTVLSQVLTLSSDYNSVHCSPVLFCMTDIHLALPFVRMPRHLINIDYSELCKASRCQHSCARMHVCFCMRCGAGPSLL